jgi:hypothetical protein
LEESHICSKSEAARPSQMKRVPMLVATRPTVDLQARAGGCASLCLTAGTTARLLLGGSVRVVEEGTSVGAEGYGVRTPRLSRPR